MVSHAVQAFPPPANWDQPMTYTQCDPAKIAYSIQEAAKATSLARSTIYNHIAAGRLRSIRVGGRRLIPADALSALLGEG